MGRNPHGQAALLELAGSFGWGKKKPVIKPAYPTPTPCKTVSGKRTRPAIAAKKFKEFRFCNACGSRFEVTHNLQLKCVICRGRPNA